MSKIVEPHGGGELKPLLLREAQKTEELKRAEGLIKVPMSSREVSDVLMMAMGAYTPINGFMDKNDWMGTWPPTLLLVESTTPLVVVRLGVVVVARVVVCRTGRTHQLAISGCLPRGTVAMVGVIGRTGGHHFKR